MRNLFFFFFTYSYLSFGQDCACCLEENRQFDFWIGDWEVFDTEGKKVGENLVHPIQSGCGLQENWTSKTLTGTSYNFFNPADSLWHQIYIDNIGTVLELKGSYENGVMELVSESVLNSKGTFSWYNRIRWSVEENGNVRQVWDIVTDKDSVLQVAFDGLYVQKNNVPDTSSVGRVTGIGGVFFKAKDPETLKAWYQTNLGMNMDEYGTNFEWREGADSSKYGFTQWSAFNHKTSYFKPSKKEFMLNYRVENIEALVEQLKANGVVILDAIETYEYGKFVHILDPEGNKIELWEPVDAEYNEIVKGRTK